MTNDQTPADHQDLEETQAPEREVDTTPSDDDYVDDGLTPQEIIDAVKAEDAKHPIAQQGEDFQPDAMPDFEERIESGEFANLSTEQISEIYRQEEIDRVIQEEEDQNLQDQIDREERDNDPDNDRDDD